METMNRLQFIKVICYLNIICLLFIVRILIIEQKTTSPFYTVNSLTSLSIKPSFRNELINERLTSYLWMYDNSSRECDTSRPLDNQQKVGFPAISKLLLSLRQQIVPYPNEYFYGRGIVLTIGPSQMKFAEVNLKMIEVSGTRLPVQIWYSSTQVSHESMIKLLDKAPKLNSSICCFNTNQCKTRTQNWQLNATHVYKPRTDNLAKHFPYKPAAIISATFAEVLFLDSDAYVTRDPKDLFLSDPMYLKFGALFYPDAYKSRQHPSVWNLFNTSCGVEEYELDSATILVDKKRVWNGLYMTKLMNDNHELFYKYVSDGDKDTFRLGFRYMDVRYYIVMIPCATGSFNGTRFCGRTLCKTDSLAQYIYINHIHIFKYEGISYTTANLDYTRIGLGDPYNNSFLFNHCRLPSASTSCFNIMKKPNPRIIEGQCYKGEIPLEEIEDRQYMLDQPLLFKKFRDNRVLISKTNNVMPHFVDNLLKYLS